MDSIQLKDRQFVPFIDRKRIQGYISFLAKQIADDMPEGEVPALAGDVDTALWGLEAKVGVEEGTVFDYVDEAGQPFKVRLVGSLPVRLSLFQGSLILAEKDFTERFPGEEGYRMFLFDGSDA